VLCERDDLNPRPAGSRHCRHGQFPPFTALRSQTTPRLGGNFTATDRRALFRARLN